MKKTLFLLAATAFALSTSPAMAKVVTVRPSASQINSPTMGNTIGLSATLINSTTGGHVWYDLRTNPINEPPFDIDQGHIYWGFELNNKFNESIELNDLNATTEDTAVKITADDSLVLDFTYNFSTLTGPTEAEYVVVMFRHQKGDGDYFAPWYENNTVPITGKFANGTYDAYVIAETCDMDQDASTYGGLVFFNESVADAVLAAEVDPNAPVPEPEPEPSTPTIPEPTTATLSLLALAGLAARRRRK